MAVYGSKVYGAFKYGAATTTDISVYPFTTQSLDYGTIKLSWVYPTSTADFDIFSIVRSPLGFPITPDGGDLIFKINKSGPGGISTAGTGGTSLLGLEGNLPAPDTGSFYDPITGLITTTYTSTVAYDTNGSTSVTLTAANANIKVGQAVKYTPSGLLTGANAGSGIVGGTTVAAINGTNLTLSNAAAIPAGTTLTFTPTFLTPGKSYYYSAFVFSKGYWIRVGTALGTSVKNYNTADIMYDSLPQIYRTSPSSSTLDSNNKNNDLYNFLRVIGVQYDFIKTKVETANNRYDMVNVGGKLLPALMDQMGFSYESGLGIHQGRRLLSNADYIYLNKGTGQGLKQFVTSFTGYPATIAPIVNLFLTLDCSSFETSTGFWKPLGTAITIEKTTATAEGGAPIPYAESASPANYANSQLGYLKATILSVAAGSTYTFTSGVSTDSIAISGTTSNNSSAGFSYITLTTDTEHGLSVGDTVIIQGMAPNYINGSSTIIAIPDTKSFTFYEASATSSISIAPLGASGSVNVFNPVLYGIPVTAGTAYTFSIYSRAKTTLRSISVGTVWYDKLGNTVNATTINSVNNSTSAWTRISDINRIAPTYAAFAVPYVRINSPANGEIHYFDAAQFEAATSTTTYEDSRRVDIYLNAPRVNEIINPGFEDSGGGVAGWGSTGTVVFTALTGAGNVYPTAAVGLGTAISTQSAVLGANASTSTMSPSNPIAITGGAQYAFSAYVKGSNPDSVTVTVVWKNSGGLTIQTDTSAALTLPTSTFSRLSLAPISGSTQMIAPATATTASITITFTGASGRTYYVDSVLFEKSSYVNAYFDGSTGYNITDDLAWEQNAAGTKGTAGTGRSLYYPNRLTTQNRLKAVLEEYLPLGTSYSAIIGTTIT